MNYHEKRYSDREKIQFVLRQKVKIENLIRENKSLKSLAEMQKKMFNIVAALYLITVFSIGLSTVI